MARQAGGRPKGTPTDTNMFCLSEHFGDRAEASARIRPTDRPHLKRCLAAGLLEADRATSTLRLTEAGKAALAAWRVHASKCLAAAGVDRWFYPTESTPCAYCRGLVYAHQRATKAGDDVFHERCPNVVRA